jgi:MoaA/NifB/PqqE/SkfB family radical SAM enzyme
MLDPELLVAYNAVRTTSHKSVFCHAPFASMNFAQNGDATVCCYNRAYVLGTYPTDTLDEIWHGPRAATLRDAMSRNALPPGCDLCLSQFWSANFSGLRARSFDHLSDARYTGDDGRLLALPKLMEFEISNVCNLECTMCTGFFSSSIRHNREKLPPLKNPYDDCFVRQLEAFIPHLKEARFLGGEPFLVRTYYQIWDMIARLNPDISVSITTNATVLNDRVKGILEHLRAHIIVSLDSLDRENYERIRLNANHDAVMRNLDYFRDYAARKNTSLSLAVCPMRQNWRDLPEIVDYCNARAVLVFFNTVVFPGDAAFQYMTHAELDRIVGYLLAAQRQSRGDLPRRNDEHYRDLIRQIVGYRDMKASWLDAEPAPLSVENWSLWLDNGHSARVEPSAAPGGSVRVVLGEFSACRAAGVRLNSQPVSLKANQRYVIEFSARADDRQEITLGARQARSPWENLGLCLKFGLSPKWERFEVHFLASSDDDDACFFIEIGNTVAAVELAEITLRIAPPEQVATRSDGHAHGPREAAAGVAKPLKLLA